MGTTTSAREAYDAIPYERLVHRFTHPDRIAVAALLAGLDPAPVATARVLELGCASGDNLVGMACGLPGASFVGVDVSDRQIEAAQRRVADLGLPNVSFRVGDLRAVDGSWGAFDYIVAHGVLSWVGEDVRRRLLEVCRERLSPPGVAFVSYNVEAGWRFRGLVRDVLREGARAGQSPSERARFARGRLAIVAANVLEPESPWGLYLAARAEELEEESDADLLHDFLEAENEAFSLREVVRRAREAGLVYLCDAQAPFVPEEPVAPALREVLDALPDDVEREMLLDVLRERTLRQSLFVRADGPVRRAVSPGSFAQLHAAAPTCDGSGGEPGSRFPGEEAAVATECDILRTLRSAWPATVPIARLLEGPGAVGVAADVLAGMLVRLQREGAVELRSGPLACGASRSIRPRASALARLQAAEGPRVTSLRHRNVTLDTLAADVLLLLDGSRTEDEVAVACCMPAAVVAAVVERLRSDSLLEA